MKKRLLIYLGLIGLMGAAGLLPGCTGPSNGKVTNGILCETAKLDVSDHRTVVVPETAVVEKGKESQCLEIRLKKELGFGGYPPYPIHVRKVRDYFGVARKKEGDALVLATYGEWSSIEGGAFIQIVIAVPETITVVKRAGLSGYKSAANQPHEPGWADFLGCAVFGRCWWYTATAPATGRTRVKTKLTGWTRVEMKVTETSVEKKLIEESPTRGQAAE
jgi:hypothetical protein